MHDDFRLGIDYGTSNTVAVLAWPDGRARPLLFDGSPVLPSAVCAGADGTLITGQEAARAARLAPERFEPNPKRRIDELDVLLGDRTYPLSELVAATLRRVAAEATRIAGAPVADVTITHPVEWGPARRALLTEAADRAGLSRPTLVPEPVAAATYFVDVLDHRVPVGHGVVVYDLGGGTFDACVVRRGADGFEPLSYQGLDDIGGVDLDALVVEIVGQVAGAQAPDEWQRLAHPSNPAELRHSRTLWEDARLAKEALSRQNTAGIFVPLVDRDVHVTREQFESAARAALTRTAEATLSAIRQARITPADVAGLFLVGGSTRVPMAATLLHQRVGLAPIALEQPEIVVAEGALHHRTATGTAAPATLLGPYPPRPAPGGLGDPGPVSAVPDAPGQVSAGPGGAGATSGWPGGPVAGVHGDHSQAWRAPDGAAPVSAMPGAASPVSAPALSSTPPAAMAYQAGTPSPVPAASVPGASVSGSPAPNAGGAGPARPAASAHTLRRRRRLGLVLGICVTVLLLVAIAAGAIYEQRNAPRALPADLRSHACKYIDMTPLYTKFGVPKPSAKPVPNGHSGTDLCSLDTIGKGRPKIDVSGVTFNVDSQGSRTSGEYTDFVAAMRLNHDYPVKKLSIGDEAVVGPLPDFIAAQNTGAPSPAPSGPAGDGVGYGLEIVVRKADYLILIEVDLDFGEWLEGAPRPTIPRERLDTEADALAQVARASLRKVSAVMH
ncbi:hypothetical protein Athai_53310 [Actinocatenispora thailandica]|uniref:Hsp70 protein n=1 Tax=Actinocatenispora thailandica TaxID=227318 RepID=A0A7R7DU22_9ACTN|nr:hypothetical protein Athai_53310 [Actinocatenispora thailandica]